VPIPKGSDGRMQKVDIIIPNLQALPQNEKATPYSIATHKGQQTTIF